MFQLKVINVIVQQQHHMRLGYTTVAPFQCSVCPTLGSSFVKVVLVVGFSACVFAGNAGSVSRCAHFRRSMETVSVRVPRSTLKYFGAHEITLNGPS